MYSNILKPSAAGVSLRYGQNFLFLFSSAGDGKLRQITVQVWQILRKLCSADEHFALRYAAEGFNKLR